MPKSGLGMKVACNPYWAAMTFTPSFRVIMRSAMVSAFW